MKIYIAVYLAAVIAANLTTVAFGASWSIVNALLFIGLDLTARDKLHDAWHGHHLRRNMTLLICAGSALTVLLNAQALQVAVASTLAFAGAAIVDTLMYHALRERAHLVKINGSNIFSAAVDSVVFPLVAFGWPPMWGVCLGQFVAKVCGGFIWSVILETINQRLRKPTSARDDDRLP
jgi:hypothetical protein